MKLNRPHPKDINIDRLYQWYEQEYTFWILNKIKIDNSINELESASGELDFDGQWYSRDDLWALLEKIWRYEKYCAKYPEFSTKDKKDLTTKLKAKIVPRFDTKNPYMNQYSIDPDNPEKFTKRSANLAMYFCDPEHANYVMDALDDGGYIKDGKWVGFYDKPGELHALVCTLIERELIKQSPAIVDISRAFYEEFGWTIGKDVSEHTISRMSTNKTWLSHYGDLFDSLS